ncbi:unnamed protein product [Cuscuta campestris]|uniref:Retrotransposon gag domain-containing protein n=1 Tax=Cuscuta campestris TaxID=132261 RepID=A0A484N5Z3_9ASTE|nr:unnamed protein product [Cuscuta campestris]
MLYIRIPTQWHTGPLSHGFGVRGLGCYILNESRIDPRSVRSGAGARGLRADVPGHNGPLYAAHGAAFAHVPAKMGEPQIALDWLEQMDRVLKNLRVPDADRSELASQMFRKGAYDWWKRIDQDPHTPKPWTWDRFDRAFTKEYVPTRYREERRDEFVALKQEGMSLPELRQKFDYLSQYATSLVSTPEDRLNEFVKKLWPDLRPYTALITTIDFNAAYDLIVKTEKSLDDLQATKKEDRAKKDPRPAASTGPSGKSFGFGGKSVNAERIALFSFLLSVGDQTDEPRADPRGH